MLLNNETVALITKKGGKKVTKKALITGITGQDGSYLAELLLGKGYEVHGLIRRSSSFNTGRIEHLYRDPHLEGVRLFLHYGDLADASTIDKLIPQIKPDEVYHLAAQSHVRVSFDMPEYTADITGLGAIRVLEATKDFQIQTGKKVKVYQASSSEMFGSAPTPQNEKTKFAPRSPYGVAKAAAYYATVNCRESYGIFAVNGILFNHESPRRGFNFVTRKITLGLARVKLGLIDKISLGNLESQRDWGHSKDYVEAIWKMNTALESPSASSVRAPVMPKVPAAELYTPCVNVVPPSSVGTVVTGVRPAASLYAVVKSPWAVDNRAGAIIEPAGPALSTA